MALVLRDRVKETSTVTGTGAISLDGAIGAYEAFGTVLSDGDTTYYTIVQSDSSVDEYEIGLGTYNATSDTLARTTIFRSSNSNAAVNFSAGTKDVFITYPSDRSVYKTNDGHILLPDSDKFLAGDGSDLQIYHNGTNSFIVNEAANDLVIRNAVDDKDVLIQTANQAGDGVASYILADGSTGQVVLYHYGTQILNTLSSGINVAGTVTLDDTLRMDGTLPTINLMESDTTDFNARIRLNGGNLVIQKVPDDLSTSLAHFLLEMDTGDIAFYNGSGVQKLKWDAGNERLGVGNVSPERTFHVTGTSLFSNGNSGCANDGDVMIEDDTNVVLRLATANDQSGYLAFADPENNLAGYIRYRHDNDTMVFASNATAIAALSSTGLRVGSSTAPDEPLHVDGTVKIEETSTTGPSGGGGTTNFLKLENNDDTGDTRSNIIFTSVDDGGTTRHGASIVFRKDNDTAWVSGSSYSSTLAFYTRENTGNQLERMTIRANGDVGINQLNPVAKLTVDGDGFFTGDTDDTAYTTSGVFSGTYSATYANTSSYSTPEIGLIGSAITGWGPEDEHGQIRWYTRDGSGIGRRDIAKILAVNEVGNSSTTTTSSAAIAFYTSEQNANVAERMRISDGGDVGIGTTAPAQLLHLAGPKETSIIRLQSTTNDASWATGERIGAIQFFSNDGSGAGSGTKGSINYAVQGSTGGTTYMSFSVADGYAAGTNNVERMRITDDGHVGIGTTAPETRLGVVTSSSTAYATSYTGADSYTPKDFDVLYVENSNHGTDSHAASIWFEVGNPATNTTGTDRPGRIALIPKDDEAYGSQFVFQTRQSDGALTEKLRITHDGNVGIGTTTPAQPLEVSNTGTTNSRIRITQSDAVGASATAIAEFAGSDGRHSFVGAVQSDLVLQTDVDDRIFFKTNSASRFIINNPSATRTAVLYSTNSGHSSLSLTSDGTDKLSFLSFGDDDDDNYGQIIFDHNQNILSFQNGGGTILNGTRDYLTIANDGKVGINNVLAPSYNLEVNGSFAATTKSFVIDHPTKPDHKLRYGSLEGPENGVYVRGKLVGTNTIELPEHWTGLVDEDTITVQLTPNTRWQKLYVKEIKDNTVIVANAQLLSNKTDCFYTVFAERKDVDRLEVEIPNGNT